MYVCASGTGPFWAIHIIVRQQVHEIHWMSCLECALITALSTSTAGRESAAKMFWAIHIIVRQQVHEIHWMSCLECALITALSTSTAGRESAAKMFCESIAE